MCKYVSLRPHLSLLIVFELTIDACTGQRYMDELTVMEAPAPTAFAKGLILEVEPEIYESMRRGANWVEVGKHQLRSIPSPADDAALKG